MSKGRSVYTSVGNPDFKAFTESFGILAYRPENLAELESQLTEAVTSKKLCVVEVPIDPSVNDALFEKLKTYWRDKDGN